LHKSILEFEFKSGNKAVRDEIFRAIIKLLEAISRVVNGLELARNSQADNGCGSPMLGTKSIHPGFKGMDLLGCKIFQMDAGHFLKQIETSGFTPPDC
jgi:hypothetical protein